MNKEANYLITFHATSDAMRAEKCCSGVQIKSRLRPVPRELSSSCGLALEATSVRLEKIKEVLEDNRVEIEAIYLKDKGYQQLES